MAKLVPRFDKSGATSLVSDREWIPLRFSDSIESRVLTRDSFRTRDEIEKIINGQMSDEMASKKSDYILKNDEKELLLPRVIKIIDKIKEKA